MTVDSKRNRLAAGGGQVAQFAVGVDDGAFVGGDGVGSVLEGGADVVDGGLAGFDVEGRGFEEDVGAGGGEPVADVGGHLRMDASRLLSGQASPAPHKLCRQSSDPGRSGRRSSPGGARRFR